MESTYYESQVFVLKIVVVVICAVFQAGCANPDQFLQQDKTGDIFKAIVSILILADYMYRTIKQFF